MSIMAAIVGVPTQSLHQEVEVNEAELMHLLVECGSGRRRLIDSGWR
jgi:hypothetical protein